MVVVGSAPNLGHVEVDFEFLMERAKHIIQDLEVRSRRARAFVLQVRSNKQPSHMLKAKDVHYKTSLHKLSNNITNVIP